MKPLHPSKGALPAFHNKGKCREATRCPACHCMSVTAHGVTSPPFPRQQGVLTRCEWVQAAVAVVREGSSLARVGDHGHGLSLPPRSSWAAPGSVPALPWRQGCSSRGGTLSECTSPTFTPPPGGETHAVVVTTLVTARPPLRAPCSHAANRRFGLRPRPPPPHCRAASTIQTAATETRPHRSCFNLPVISSHLPAHDPFFHSKFLGCLLLGLLTQPVALPHIKPPPPNHPYHPMHPNVPPPAEPAWEATSAARPGSHQPSAVFIHPAVAWGFPHKRPSPPARSCLWGDASAALPATYERSGGCRAISRAARKSYIFFLPFFGSKKTT